MNLHQHARLSVALATACALLFAQLVQATVRVISSRPDSVSGGDALVQVDAQSKSRWEIRLDGRDVSLSFRESERSGKITSLLDGLGDGKNMIEVIVDGRVTSRAQLINHPPSGPIFSGSRQYPFVCETEANGLGPALNANCAAESVVEYYYKSTEPSKLSPREQLIAQYDAIFSSTSVILAPGFKPYDPARPPADVAWTVMTDGRTVKYIVRRERGVINRAVYEIQFLHDPEQPLPTPWSGFSEGWNGRLVYTFGGGCGAGYHQGLLRNFGVTEFEPILAQGYALATSSLNILENTCNEQVSAETASMVKEHFIEQYGEPVYTIGAGGSGGAVSVYLIAQNHPGILDGIIAYQSAPDILTTVLPAFSDCGLLDHALKESTRAWTEAQRASISGYATWQVCMKLAPYAAQWIDPKNCHVAVPRALIYDAVSNPKGARCTFYDNAVNVFGRNSKTGFANRTLDNVGVQYGLVAFNAGKIDAEQFVELNERAGGYDHDGVRIPTRTAADPQALRVAYEHGVVLTGKSLDRIPIIDWIEYADDLADFHTRDRAFMTRARLIAARGDANNQTILVTPRPVFKPLTMKTSHVPGVGLHVLVPAMDRWLDKIGPDYTNVPRSLKMVASRPVEATDGCVAIDGERIIEPATYDGAGRCNQLYPSYGNPRVAAGGPASADILKCALKPLDPSDYLSPLTADQLERLKIVFPSGVCDYSKPGIGKPTSSRLWHTGSD